MKTAEGIYQENGCNKKSEIIEAMKEYAALVSIEVLQTAVSNLDDSMVDFGGLDEKLKFMILSTPIITP